MKKENGITLIALVISIIVLIILAGVAINTLINNGIIDKAKTATQEYKNAQDYEETQIAKYTNDIDSWTRAGSGYSVTKLWEIDLTANSDDANSGRKNGGIVTLSDSIYNYDEISITGQIYLDSNTYTQTNTLRLLKQDLNVPATDSKKFILNCSTDYSDRRVLFDFINNNQLKTDECNNARLLSVYGIKY